MSNVVNRPFFSFDVPLIAILVILAALLVSHWLVDGLYRVIF